MRAFVCGAIVLTACVQNDEPDSIVRLTWIDAGGSLSVMIDAPQVAPVGAQIPVVITTYRGGCTSPERTDIVVAVDAVDILPYDRELLVGNCTLKLCIEPREVFVRFDTPGAKTIRVHGLDQGFDIPKIVELAVEVQ
jgi:hypothetical protein